MIFPSSTLWYKTLFCVPWEYFGTVCTVSYSVLLYRMYGTVVRITLPFSCVCTVPYGTPVFFFAFVPRHVRHPRTTSHPLPIRIRIHSFSLLWPSIRFPKDDDRIDTGMYRYVEIQCIEHSLFTYSFEQMNHTSHFLPPQKEE